MTMALSVLCFCHGARTAFRREGKGPCGSAREQPVADVSRYAARRPAPVGRAAALRGGRCCSGSRWCELVGAQTPVSPVFRFYNQDTGTHFYTIVAAERDQRHRVVPAVRLRRPGVRGLRAAAAGAQPVFRFYNTKTGTHFYTTRRAERDHVIATWPQFAFEGAAYYAMPAAGSDGRTGLFRFFNTTTGAHFYTTSTAERDKVRATLPQFAYEGVAFYVYSADGVPVPPVAVIASSDGFRFLQQTSFGATPRDARARQGDRRACVSRGTVRAAGQRLSGRASTTTCRSTNPTAVRSARRAQGAAYACAINQLTLFKLRNQFFANALTKPDQLRQRVAWSLSQFFVISAMKDPDMEAALRAGALPPDAVRRGVRQLRGPVAERSTLSPQMGHYLDMVDNAKATRAAGTEPNQNFARELLQLFSIGIARTQARRHAVLDAANQPIPSYGQTEIKAFARVFTGWTLSALRRGAAEGARTTAATSPSRWCRWRQTTTPAPRRCSRARRCRPACHADADLRVAVHNVFMHPNVGPFFAKHLIRQLVTGNPSPAYVGRVAAAFNDNGSGVRGDMKAVLRAVLLDPEARGDVKTDPATGC